MCYQGLKPLSKWSQAQIFYSLSGVLGTISGARLVEFYFLFHKIIGLGLTFEPPHCKRWLSSHTIANSYLHTLCFRLHILLQKLYAFPLIFSIKRWPFSLPFVTVFCICNIVIWQLVGAAALGVGIWVAVDGTIFLQLLSNIPDSGTYGRLISEAAYILIAAGGFIFLLAFFGCCGAWKKNKCLLMVVCVHL